jgi:Family of unknown function (DUF6399)
MTPPHSIDTTPPRTDPFRWEQFVVATTFDHFDDPDRPSSQRQYAQQQGIPRSTLGYWLRRPDPAGVDPDLVSFFRSCGGLRFLRRLVLALFVTFVFRGGCGLRLLCAFLQHSQLDRFVASSTGALHELSLILQTDLTAFADEERPRLAQDMPPRRIAVVADENFHGPHICLVAAEPVSNFILVEQYAERRDAATWTAAIAQGIAGLAVTIVLMTSDEAKGLIACAHHGLGGQHLAEMFHGQRDLCQPILGPLQRQKQSADRELQQAQEQLHACRTEAEQARSKPRGPGGQKDYDRHIAHNELLVQVRTQQVQQCHDRHEQALEAVRGLADDYHPFDSHSGAAVGEAEVQKRLGQRLQTLEQVARQAELPDKAFEALAGGNRWVETLVAAMAWFWSVARGSVQEMDLPDEVESAVYEKVLPGLYWQQAARRARTAEQRQQREELAQRLLGQAWAAGGVLWRLNQENQEKVKRVSREVVGLFCRSSSCVEGRNGRLALFHHGHSRLSAGRLKALTVIHNYHTTRADGTTAAERFFGKKPRDLFSWLLERLPDLPRPAAKRPNKAAQPAAKAG